MGVGSTALNWFTISVTLVWWQCWGQHRLKADSGPISCTCVRPYWSPCLVRSHYCQQLTLSVCLSVFVCHAPSNCFFLFVSRWNRAIFWPSVLHVALYKTVFFNFWFRPPNAQNLLPKICTKSPISQLVWQIDRRCLGLPGGFRGCKMLWGRTLLPWQWHLEIQSPTGLHYVFVIKFIIRVYSHPMS